MRRIEIRQTAWVAATLLAGAAAAGSTDEAANLARRLDAIESRLQAVETTTSWLDARRAHEVRLIIADVLEDADARAALADDLPTAGWDDGFFIQSADGDFRLEVSGQIQARFVWNRRQLDDELLTLDGFEIRRLKIKLEGHLITPDLGYTIGLARRRNNSQMVLQSYNIRYRLSDAWTVMVGRARPPLLREEEVSSKRQLAVERSLVARAFRQTRTVGLMARYADDHIRMRAGLMDANPRNDDSSDDDPSGEAFDERVRAAMRTELMLAGRKWGDLDDFSSFPGTPLTVMLGAGVLFQWEQKQDPNAVSENLLRWSIDLTVDLSGANLFAYIVGNHADRDTASNLDQYGIVVQGGFFVGEAWELFARYEYGDADGEAEELSVLTVGVNHFIEEHALKLTADVGYGFRPVEKFWANEGAGWLEDEPNESGQIVMRVQMQLLF